MDISKFKGLLGAGGARPNQFRVLLNWPGYVTSVPDREYALLVTGAALPASTVNPTLVQYRGIFDPWTVTIINDTEMSLRKPFEEWMNGMNDLELNTGVLTPTDYQADVIVQHLDRNDEVLMEYTLYNSFPINMSEIGLQYGQNDVIEEFTVTFNYSHYLTNTL